MSIELSLLVWSVALAFAQMLVAVAGATEQVGVLSLVGNREDFTERTGWAGRAVRAHRNMIENLMLFAPLVLVAAVADRTNSVTALGAHLFFWARLVYTFVYLIGIPWLRTGVWTVSVLGLILIFSQLL